MLSLIISILVSLTGVIVAMGENMSKGATIAIAVAGLILTQLVVGLVLRKKTAAVTNDLQEMIMGGQKRITNKVQQFQHKPGGNPKLIQRQIERDQQDIFKKALEYTTRFEPLKKWNLLMEKQIATMRMQFLFQLKEFKQVDALLSRGLLTGPMMMEPLMVGMKMARQFKNKDIKARAVAGFVAATSSECAPG